MVDLNGSAEGRAVNGAAVEAILNAVSIPVQLGGGVRSLAEHRGLDRGRRQPGDPGHGGGARPGAGQDGRARHGPSRSRSASTCARARWRCRAGWRTRASTPSTVARRFEDAGVSALIVTDIDRDGALAGFNVEVFGAMADAVDIPVIAAGGLASVADIERLRERAGHADRRRGAGPGALRRRDPAGRSPGGGA